MTTTISTSAGELVHIHPADLHLGANVRTEASIGSEFTASIATHGVLQPISAIRHDDGTVEVRDGQRRTLAAREAGLKSVPVYVLTDADADVSAAEVARITHQIVTNDQREALTQAQRITAVEQILNLGVTPTKAAKALSIKRSTVEAVAATVKSQRAREEAEAGNMTLEQAAILVEFEDDEAAVDSLVYAARGSRFEHVAAQLRQKREDDARRQQASQPYADRGFTVREDYPHPWNLAANEQPMNWLRKDGEPVTDDAITDPKHWTVFLEEIEVFLDDTGEQVSRSGIDWHAKAPGDTVGTDKDGNPLVPIHRITHSHVYRPVYSCLDLEAAGLTGRDRSAANFGVKPAKTADEAREERRRTIALNKQFRAATGVRTTFVKALLARKSAPATAAAWTASQLADDPNLLSEYNANTTARELLGVKDGDPLVPDTTSDNRAQVITFGLVIGALENRARKNTWRQWDRSRTDTYLCLLRELGYQASEVEEVMAKERAPEDVTIATE